MAVRLQASYLENLGDQYRLQELRFISEAESIADFSSIPVTDPQNKTLGMLAWNTDRPGDLLLANMILPLSLLVIIISIITVFLVYASRNTMFRLNQAYTDLEFSANHDSLTGLANRRLFNELLIQTIHSVKRENISCAMLYIDLDDFKNVNDLYGHKAGDQFLITIAERIKSSVRESDTTARVGGDEFIVLLHNISSHEDIIATARKILSNLTRPADFLNNEALISASIGVTMIPGDGMEPDVLMSKADIAMYECKKKGKNAFLFYADASL
jgi:diguanylate cyclase (GGDEF)-like protein